MSKPKAITDTELRSLCRGYTRAGVQVVGGIMSEPTMHPMARLKAFELLMDRGWGKAAQFIEHASSTGPAEIKLVIINAQNSPRAIIDQSESVPDCRAALPAPVIRNTTDNALIEHKPDKSES